MATYYIHSYMRIVEKNTKCSLRCLHKIQTSTPTTNGKCQLPLVYHSVQCKEITNSKITIPESNLFGANWSLISIKLQVYHESQHHPTPFMAWFVCSSEDTNHYPDLLQAFACCYINLEPRFWRRLCRNKFSHPQVWLSRWTAFKTFNDIPLYWWITVIGILIVAYYDRHKLNGYHPLYVYVNLKYYDFIQQIYRVFGYCSGGFSLVRWVRIIQPVTR